MSLIDIWRKRNHVASEDLSEYISGRLGPSEAQRTERHMSACPVCSQELASLQHTVQLLKRVPNVQPVRSFALQTVPMVQADTKVGRLPNWSYGAAAASLVLFLAVLVSVDLGGVLSQEERAGVAPEAPAAAALAAQAPPSAAVEEPIEPVGDASRISNQELQAPPPITQVAPPPLVPAPSGVEGTGISPVPASAPDSAVADEPPQEGLAVAEMAMVPGESTLAERTGEQDIPSQALDDTQEETQAASSVQGEVDAPVTSPQPEPLVEPPSPEVDGAGSGEVFTPSKNTGGGTGAIWRALEGVLGFLVVASLSLVLWRWRRGKGHIAA